MEMKALCESLDGFMGKVDSINLESHASEFFEVMLDFRAFISKEYKEGELDEFFESSNFATYKAFFQQKNVLYLKGVETLEVEKTLNESNRGIDQAHIKASYLGKNVDFSMLNQSTVRSIAIVGAGSYSETMLYSHNETDVDRVIAIDYDEKAISSAARLAEFMKLDKLTLVHIDAREYDYADLDAIYLTGFLHPKSEILKSIAASAKSGTQILVESCTHHLQKLVYDDFEIDEAKFKITDAKKIVSPYHYRTVTHLTLV